MLKSMTGYGVASMENSKFKVSVEIKTLNSKYLDASIRIPRSLSSKEIEIRNILGAELERGKVTLSVDFQLLDVSEPKAVINKTLIQKYYSQLKEAADLTGAETNSLFGLATQMPNAIENLPDDESSEEDWAEVKVVLMEAISKVQGFRDREGKEVEDKFREYVNSIASNLEEINKLDPSRVDAVRTRLDSKLSEIKNDEQFDKNRFEQELIYFIEKLDINEEKVRLSSHVQHFLDVLNLAKSNGKKLGFISQEMGREINTIGSKAQHAQMQQHVVAMKEELEKIKEQILNVL